MIGKDNPENKEVNQPIGSDEDMSDTCAVSISTGASSARVLEDINLDADLALVLRLQQGDAIAFQELVVKYQKWVYSLCYRVLGNHAEADDITQETFVAVFRHIKRFKSQPNATFAGWLYRITVNLCRNQIRKQNRRREESLDAPVYISEESEKPSKLADVIPDDSMNPKQELVNQELNALIQTALNSLSVEHRIAFILHEQQELSYKEIAEIMQCPIGTVMSRLYHAKRELRKKLKKYL
ncbi:MAG: sigma-70 family RNA polymerase sigma factor [bacterium]|nr:sigma-70 family RNA polymerase sigma factor [bacterium]